MVSLATRLPGALLAGALAVALLVAGCAAGQASPTPQLSSSPPPSPSGPTPGSFYLRAWRTQALEPQYTFGWLPVATVTGGSFIDGQVAVPAIYPGPLWIGPSASPISEEGIATIVAEAGRLGMLGETGDFTADMAPGSVVGHILMVVNGRSYELAGDPERLLRCRCIPEPGTAPAFAAFWQQVTNMREWLGEYLGPSQPYQPERLAVLVRPPVEGESGITPGQMDWPLATSFTGFGADFGGGLRCGVVSGADLALLVPVLKQANQLTRFEDAEGAIRSLQTRVLVPTEPSPCG
jgi:hypothetical protein